MALLIFPPLPFLPASHPGWWQSPLSCVLLPFSLEVVSLPVGSGDPLPPSEVRFACCGWKLRPGAQVYRVSWRVTLGPRCQIPEPWPGQAMPRESRSQTLMNCVWEDGPGFHSLSQAFLPQLSACFLLSAAENCLPESPFLVQSLAGQKDGCLVEPCNSTSASCNPSLPLLFCSLCRPRGPFVSQHPSVFSSGQPS